MNARFLIVNIVMVCFLGLLGVACNESGEGPSSSPSSVLSDSGVNSDNNGVTVSELPEGQEASSLLDGFEKSAFSEFVWFDRASEAVALHLDFFPVGYDYCSQPTYDAKKNPNGCQVAGTVVIPCEVSLAAPTEPAQDEFYQCL